jgi:hypothetical protein
MRDFIPLTVGGVEMVILKISPYKRRVLHGEKNPCCHIVNVVLYEKSVDVKIVVLIVAFVIRALIGGIKKDKRLIVMTVFIHNLNSVGVPERDVLRAEKVDDGALVHAEDALFNSFYVV